MKNAFLTVVMLWLSVVLAGPVLAQSNPVFNRNKAQLITAYKSGVDSAASSGPLQPPKPAPKASDKQVYSIGGVTVGLTLYTPADLAARIGYGYYTYEKRMPLSQREDSLDTQVVQQPSRLWFIVSMSPARFPSRNDVEPITFALLNGDGTETSPTTSPMLNPADDSDGRDLIGDAAAMEQPLTFSTPGISPSAKTVKIAAITPSGRVVKEFALNEYAPHSESSINGAGSTSGGNKQGNGFIEVILIGLAALAALHFLRHH